MRHSLACARRLTLRSLVMGTRAGDIDPAVPLHMMRTLGLSAGEMDTVLNKKSGLLGLCGDNDLRAVIERRAKGDPEVRGGAAPWRVLRRLDVASRALLRLLAAAALRARSCRPAYRTLQTAPLPALPPAQAAMAMDVFVYRVRKYIGAYLMALNGHVDAIVFSAGKRAARRTTRSALPWGWHCLCPCAAAPLLRRAAVWPGSSSLAGSCTPSVRSGTPHICKRPLNPAPGRRLPLIHDRHRRELCAGARPDLRGPGAHRHQHRRRGERADGRRPAGRHQHAGQQGQGALGGGAWRELGCRALVGGLSRRAAARRLSCLSGVNLCK